jgi:hypothetical protein
MNIEGQEWLLKNQYLKAYLVHSLKTKMVFLKENFLGKTYEQGASERRMLGTSPG